MTRQLSGRTCAIVATALVAAWLALSVASLCYGETKSFSVGAVTRGFGALLAADAERLPGFDQTVFELRLWRTLCAGLVGASLALAGTMFQGLFRNGLAAPSLLGVTSGASLGATLAILLLGGYGPILLLDGAFHGVGAPLLVTLAAFAGALGVSLTVLRLASGDGPVSVPTLLLVGVAINTCLGGIMATIQSVMLEDWEVSRSIMAWTFGTLDDRKGYHAAMVGTGLLLAIASVPFIAVELDLFAAGEDDARSLGVATGRVQTLVLLVAALAAACAVATAGQIAFVGLVVPHVLRLLTGDSHRTLLWLAPLGGAVFLLGTDLLQIAAWGDRRLQPGVLMSVLGGPFFLWLLVGSRQRRRVRGW